MIIFNACWETWENEQNLDIVSDWKLYRNGIPVEGNGTESISAADDKTLEFTVLFSRLDGLENLTLVPEYSQTGEHPDEAIIMIEMTAE